jgi:hypothetical protein
MLDKTGHFDIDERLRPMFMEAIDTQSFGLRIVATAYISNMTQTETGMTWAWGLYYQAAGVPDIGKGHWSGNVGHLTMISHPYATQEEVNDAIASGCENLRAMLAQKNQIANGRG